MKSQFAANRRRRRGQAQSRLWLVVLLCYHRSAAAAFALPDPAAAWGAYKVLLIEKPLITKAATAAVLSGVSDAITQRVEPAAAAAPAAPATATADGKFIAAPAATAPKRTHDWIRSLHLVITGFVWSGPIAHYWYATLERIMKVLTAHAPVLENQFLGLCTRLSLDAVLFSPFTIAGYFSVRTVLDGKGVLAICDKLRAVWKRALVAAWKFWPAVNIFSYWFLAIQYRVLYGNIMALLWTGYLSFVNSMKQQQKSS